MNCPYCGEPVNHGALVCKTCRRDIGLVVSLTEAKEALERRVHELEAELEKLRPAEGAPAEPPPPPEPPKPPRLVDLLVLFWLLPVALLVGVHYLLVIRFDVSLVWLRSASIVLPAIFGWFLDSRIRARWFVILGAGFAVALPAVLGMSTMVYFTDGSPILPKTAVDWRETFEYIASISLAYLLGSLLLLATHPLLRKATSGRTIQMVTFLITKVTGKKPGPKRDLPLEEKIQRLVKLINLGVSAATAAGAVYTGFKGIL
jgi:hypothetical protein